MHDDVAAQTRMEAVRAEHAVDKVRSDPSLRNSFEKKNKRNQISSSHSFQFRLHVTVDIASRPDRYGIDFVRSLTVS